MTNVKVGKERADAWSVLAPDPRFDEIDAMTGRQFEAALAELFALLGYAVTRIGGFDKGADLVLERDGVRTAVQAKRRASAVRIDAVRQLVDGMRRYDCGRGLVVTNSYFTEPAVECAREWGIELWDRRRLAEFIEGEEPRVDTSVCAECGRPVTEGIAKWCLDRPARYGGNVLCMEHQRRTRRDAA